MLISQNTHSYPLQIKINDDGASRRDCRREALIIKNAKLLWKKSEKGSTP